MSPVDTSEKGLESIIEQHLLNEEGYVKGESADYDKIYCVDKTQLFRFLFETQEEKVNKSGIAEGGLKEEKFLRRLADQIKAKGIVEVLRKGIKHGEIHFDLFYLKPASDLNEAAKKQYESNIFSVTRQLHFSKDNANLSLDLGLFINGLPIATAELKNRLTGQTVKDAIWQYKNDRDPNEPLFAFGRCLVHFAVDDNLVYMTTRLSGPSKTNFLPFNKGHNHGAGNPPNQDGIMTDYLWKDILTKDSLSVIIEKYSKIITETGDDGRTKKILIFPRYHQRDLVRKMLAHARENGAGNRYLIQHSAGSGKSKSITWLAHQLVELTDESNQNTVFDSVIVVTDRRVLDKQIRDNIKQYAYVKDVVEAITEGSRQLKEALEEGKKIVITTIQKFPYIVEDIGKLPAKRFAIIIDEAHSGQGGETTAKMHAALSNKERQEGETNEDMINRIIESRKMLTNASYFAFTATPKSKTLETFGVKRTDGSFEPFHVYSMRQAIEEEFILDVLSHYTTYQSYYKLLKKIEDDPKFDSKRAQKKLRRFVETHRYAIQQKAQIMIDHFMDEVIKKKKINGNAKAMVVTSGIVHAIRYKQAFDKYLAEIKSPYKAIVAFSGSKKDDGVTYDEASMNGFPSADIPQEFKKSEYRFLIVAEKFQTGYDEPLLHTMYVDKVLSDVKAVQTLSRLNRAKPPHKRDTFILDFVNSSDAIQKAFEPYYKTTILSEETDLNRLNDLQDSLDGFQVYSKDQVEELMTRYLNGASREELDPILNACSKVYSEELDTDHQIDFKAKAKMFVRAYQFLASILPIKKVYWESLSTFLKLLVRVLPEPEDIDLSEGILESVDMDSYRAEQEQTIKIKLEGDKEIDPTPTDIRGAGFIPELDLLSNIIREFNDRFGTDWTDNDRVRRLVFEELPAIISEDEEYLNAKNHSDRQNARITHERKLKEKFQDIMMTHTELYKKFSDDPEFRKWLSDTLFKLDYDSGYDHRTGQQG